MKNSLFLILLISGCSKSGDGFAPGTSTIAPSNPPVTAPFDPSQISGIHSWFDASDATTMTLDGQQVSAWTDKNDHTTKFMQTTSNAQPLLQTSAINGKSALSFDGTSDTMSASILKTVGADVSFSYVVKLTNYDSKIPFSFNNPVYSYGPDVYFNAGQLSWNIGDTNANAFTNSVFPSTSEAHIITVKNDSALNRASLYVDGTLVGTAAYRNTSISNFAAPRLYVGSWADNNFKITGFFAELVIYNKVIDETERADLEYYLKSKWGTP